MRQLVRRFYAVRLFGKPAIQRFHPSTYRLGYFLQLSGLAAVAHESLKLPAVPCRLPTQRKVQCARRLQGRARRATKPLCKLVLFSVGASTSAPPKQPPPREPATVRGLSSLPGSGPSPVRIAGLLERSCAKPWGPLAHAAQASLLTPFAVSTCTQYLLARASLPWAGAALVPWLPTGPATLTRLISRTGC